jgi:hypothetical protein
MQARIYVVGYHLLLWASAWVGASLPAHGWEDSACVTCTSPSPFGRSSGDKTGTKEPSSFGVSVDAVSAGAAAPPKKECVCQLADRGGWAALTARIPAMLTALFSSRNQEGATRPLHHGRLPEWHGGDACNLWDWPGGQAGGLAAAVHRDLHLMGVLCGGNGQHYSPAMRTSSIERIELKHFLHTASMPGSQVNLPTAFVFIQNFAQPVRHPEKRLSASGS